MSPNPITITIAICTWNRCDLLRQTLERLTEVATPHGCDWDVVVVNNNCTDETSAVVASFGGRLRIREVVEPVAGLSHARNRALDEVRSDYIAWIDDDVLVADDWLSSLVGAIGRHPEAHAFGGPIEPWFVQSPDPDVLAAFPVLQRGFCGLDHGDQEIRLGPKQAIYGANMAYAMAGVGTLRFDATLGPVKESNYGEDEVEFQARLRSRGSHVVWIPGMRVKHYVDPSRMTLEYLTKFMTDRGRAFIRRGRPDGERRLFGAPRWVWPLFIGATARYWLFRFTPFRRAKLRGLRDYCQYRGIVSEALLRARQRETSRPATADQ